MESQIAVTQYKYKGIKGNVLHPVTHIWEYLNLVIIDIIQYFMT